MSEEDKISLVRLDERLTNFMAGTIDYRNLLCEKISRISDKLENLPCKERGEMYKGMGLTVKLLWLSIGTTFGLLVAHLGWK